MTPNSEVGSTVQDKWQFIAELDERLLQGGVIVSEWAAFLVRDADTAYVNGAHLSSLIASLAAIETHLRTEHGNKNHRLVDLTETADFEPSLRNEIHELRRFRNGWVHVADPWDDRPLLDRPEEHEVELENMARRGIVALRRTLYANPWV